MPKSLDFDSKLNSESIEKKQILTDFWDEILVIFESKCSIKMSNIISFGFSKIQRVKIWLEVVKELKTPRNPASTGRPFFVM